MTGAASVAPMHRASVPSSHARRPLLSNTEVAWPMTALPMRSGIDDFIAFRPSGTASAISSGPMPAAISEAVIAPADAPATLWNHSPRARIAVSAPA